MNYVMCFNYLSIRKIEVVIFELIWMCLGVYGYLNILNFNDDCI